MKPRALTALQCLLIFAACGCSHSSSRFSPQPGDLLFQDSNGGALSDAIKDVTTGYANARLSHVGMVAAEPNGHAIVLEAVSRGVVATDLDAFLNKAKDPNGRPRVIVGRLNEPYRRLIPAAIREATALEGKPYDKLFAIDNDAYYCSELIYEVFRRANEGRPVFPLEPMTFKNPQTGQTTPAWTEYFAQLGAAIPEGQPGINPGALSRSPALTIVYSYTRP